MFPLGKNRSSPTSLNLCRASFTLIELLVVLALVAILSVVVVVTLNPAELLKQARDSNRLSDLATINTALNLFSTDVTSGFMGTSTIIYVSIPDTSPTCANLGLPIIPTSTYTYNCVTSQNLRNTDGTGWIPVNFNRISSNSPISQLPIDPQNTTSTKYYTYVTGGSWKVMATPESQKYLATAGTDGGSNIGQFEVGNNMSLAPFADGLVGWWKFDEGSGTSTVDSSGWGYPINLNSGASWGGGRSGNSLTLDGVSDDVRVSVTSANYDFSALKGITFSIWVNQTSFTCWNTIAATSKAISPYITYTIQQACSSGQLRFYVADDTGAILTATGAAPLGEWHHAVGVWSSSGINFYIDGQLAAFSAGTLGYSTNSLLTFGRLFAGPPQYFSGKVDDVRIYKRALSAAEVSALYSSTK